MIIELLVDRKERGVFEPAGSILTLPDDIADQLISRRIARLAEGTSGGSVVTRLSGSSVGTPPAARLIEAANKSHRQANQSIKRKPNSRG